MKERLAAIFPREIRYTLAIAIPLLTACNLVGEAMLMTTIAMDAGDREGVAMGRLLFIGAAGWLAAFVAAGALWERGSPASTP